MIITVSLNPSVDKTCRGLLMRPGQVNRMQESKDLAGGKGINVTRVLRSYGEEVRALGFLGGYTGTLIEEAMQELSATCAFTKVKEPTRTNINVITEDGYVTEILEPGPQITEEEWQRFLKEYEQSIPAADIIVLSGSLARGIPDNGYATLIQLAKRQNKKVLLDTSGPALKEGAAAAPYLVKPNKKELEFLTGRSIKSEEDICDAAMRLFEQGIQMVAVSLGEKGMVLADEKEMLFARAPKVKTCNTVGCGDTAVASFVLSYLRGENRETALKWAVARSAANAATMENGCFSETLAGELFEAVAVTSLR